MATKELLFKDKQNNVTDNGQYNNFTLNKNHQISYDAFSGRSKSVIIERKVLDYGTKLIRRTAAPKKLSDFANDSQTKKESHSWKKSAKDLSLNFANKSSGREDRLKKGKGFSASTLSLHIEAYEKSNDANLSVVANEDLKTNNLIKKGLNAKQIDFDSTLIIQNPFEFSRQEENDEAVNPEIAQYRASQRLLNPNIQRQQAPVQQPLLRNNGGDREVQQQVLKKLVPSKKEMDSDDDYIEDIPEKKPKLETLTVLPQKDIFELFNTASDEEVVFKWTELELREMLADFVRFMVFKAAFPDLESNPGPHKKIFKSYKLLNTELNSMCNFMITHLDLPEEFIGAVRRHSQRVVCYRYVNEPCVVCQSTSSHKVQYLGPNYQKNDLKPEKTFPPQFVFFCYRHTYFADTFFSLVHMKWNIHLNVKHRIKQGNILYRGNKNIDADIGNEVITNLAVYYFHIICRLRSTDATLMNMYTGSPLVFRNALRSLEIKTRYQKVSKK